MGQPHVIVVGSVNVDMTLYLGSLPEIGETVMVREVLQAVGGKGANQAVAAALSGVSSSLVAAVGADDAAVFVTAELARAGVRLLSSVVPSSPTGRAWISVDAAGENTIVVHSGANAELTANAAVAALSDAGGGLGTDAVVLTQGEIPGPTVDAVAAFAQRNGLRFVLNLAPVVYVEESTLTEASPLIVNELEWRQLAARLTGSADRAGELAGRLKTDVVVTRGADGASVLSPDGSVADVPSVVVEHVVDTSGAGDAFVGALAAALAESGTLRDAVDAAVRAGAHAVTSKGASQIPPA